MSLNDNMNVKGGPTVSVQQVGYTKVELGKRAAPALKQPDVVKAAMDKIANPPAPREQMRGQRSSKNYDENGKAFRSSGFTSTDTGANN